MSLQDAIDEVFGDYFTDRDWNITDQSWPFTRIFNLASNPRTTINVQNHDQSIVNKNNNATKFYQSDEMLRNAQSKLACKKLGPNAGNKIKMTRKNTNKPMQNTLEYKNYKNLVAG